MIQVPIKDIVSKICKATGLSEEEVRKKIATKVEQLYGLVSEEGAAHIVANEYGIKVFDVSGEMKIKDVLLGMKSVDVTGKVVRKYELREFNTEKRKGKVANLMMADETGSIRVVFWNDKTNDFAQLKEDDVLKIRGAYVRDNAGRKELHMGDNSQVIINPVGVAINTKERKEYDRKHISELSDGVSAEILGTVVQVFDIRFFEVCPKCNKRMRLRAESFECDEHGREQPSYNYIMNVYLDDGTSNIRVNFWKAQAQRLLKLDDSQIVKFKDSGEFEKYKTELLGEQIKILGTAKNTMMNRLEFTAEVVFTDLNPEHEIEMLDHAKTVVLDAKGPAKTKVASSDNDEFEISEDFLE
ncbi:MAG: OB-fold nucleic acid binding domain-containing protein [Candidatus Woesearchaeota archaeon]